MTTQRVPSLIVRCVPFVPLSHALACHEPAAPGTVADVAALGPALLLAATVEEGVGVPTGVDGAAVVGAAVDVAGEVLWTDGAPLLEPQPVSRAVPAATEATMTAAVRERREREDTGGGSLSQVQGML
jgi:hypothetical protein